MVRITITITVTVTGTVRRVKVKGGAEVKGGGTSGLTSRMMTPEMASLLRMPSHTPWSSSLADTLHAQCCMKELTHAGAHAHWWS